MYDFIDDEILDGGVSSDSNWDSGNNTNSAVPPVAAAAAAAAAAVKDEDDDKNKETNLGWLVEEFGMGGGGPREIDASSLRFLFIPEWDYQLEGASPADLAAVSVPLGCSPARIPSLPF